VATVETRKRVSSQAPAEAEPKLEVRAEARWLRTSPRKAQLVVDEIRGRGVVEARTILAFMSRAAARDVEKVLKSAVANAEANHGLSGDDLYISAAYVGVGPTLKRWRARARGRVGRIRKRSCHITILVTPLETYEAPPPVVEEPQRPKRARRTEPPAEAPPEPAVAEKPKPTRARKPAAEAVPVTEEAEAVPKEAEAVAPVAEEAPAGEPEAPAEEAPAAEAPKPRRTRAKKPAAETAAEAPETGAAADEPEAAAEKPKTTRRRKKPDEESGKES
jgi:large subunit ribosomal protein L22